MKNNKFKIQKQFKSTNLKTRFKILNLLLFLNFSF